MAKKQNTALTTTNQAHVPDVNGRVKVNEELARKFQEASQKKTSINDFMNEFLMQFLSPDTKTAYMKDLQFFFDFLRSGNVAVTHPNQIQSFHFGLYRDHLIERGLASATVNRRLVCIRSFMKWSVAARLIDHNPLDVVKLPKIQTESPTLAFDDEEVVRMLNAPDTKTHRGALHRVSMALLFNLGLRRSELTHIRLMDFAKERGHTVLRIHGKGDKVRLIPINEGVHTEIQRYLDHLKENGVTLDFEDYLLQIDLKSKNEKPIDGSTIYRIIEKYAKDLGINKRVSPHSCRATVISHLLDTQSAPIRDVAIFAGHANITTTERYDKRRQNLKNSAAYHVDYKKTS